MSWHHNNPLSLSGSCLRHRCHDQECFLCDDGHWQGGPGLQVPEEHDLGAGAGDVTAGHGGPGQDAALLCVMSPWLHSVRVDPVVIMQPSDLPPPGLRWPAHSDNCSLKIFYGVHFPVGVRTRSRNVVQAPRQPHGKCSPELEESGWVWKVSHSQFSFQYPSRGGVWIRMTCHRLLCFRWCVAEPCYQYQWVVRDGDVFCQRSDGLRVDSKTALYFSLINKIMFSISSTRPTLWEQKEWDLGRGRSKKCRQQTGEPRNIVPESSVVLTSPHFVNDTLNSHDLVSSFRYL